MDENCPWCGKQLSAGEQLRNAISEEDALDPSAYQTKFLEKEMFAGPPIALCDHCRREIEFNRAQLDLERDAEESDWNHGRLIWIAGALVLLISVLAIALAKVVM